MLRHNQEKQERNFVATKLFMHDNHKTNSVELCRDIFKVRRDIIPGKGIKDCSDIKLEPTTKSWGTNKRMSRRNFSMSQQKHYLGQFLEIHNLSLK